MYDRNSKQGALFTADVSTWATCLVKIKAAQIDMFYINNGSNDAA